VSDGRWKQLVRDLDARGYSSEVHERLRRRLDVEQAHEDLEREIRHEIACALGRSAEKVDVALLHLELARVEVETAASRAGRLAAVRAFNAARDAAWRARYELIVHREAVGFRHNEAVERLYPIPARIRFEDF
jgi:hypothetical protein